MDFYQFLNNFVALLVICNPLSALPAVLRITQNQTLAEKRQTGLISAFAVLVILLVSTWFGSAILTLLGIQIPAFQVAGGIVILMMAFSMLSAEESPIKQSPDEAPSKRSKESGAIIPLAIPLIAGPGAISTIIVNVSQYEGIFNLLIISCLAILVSVVMGALLYFASNLEKVMGQSRINLINRLGGLILAAIAVQTIASGLRGLFPGLQH
ncbi:MAG TPA: MarC family protein [Chlamydiales bacterium]|nr:MarC family protein [Chlamydiales bacterium]